MDFIEEIKPLEKNNHSIWVEKYRPTTLNEYIGNESIKEKFSQFIKKGDIPHILLFGPPGTGKSSISKILVKNIKCDYIYINASDQTSVDDVRGLMKNYASSAGFYPLKVIILDEFEKLSYSGQCALRNMTETYSAYTRFILTTNFLEKVLPAIASRMQTFEIKPVSKKDVALRLVDILEKENVSFSQEDVVFIVNTYYPDIRKVINFTQQSSVENESGKLIIKITKENVVEVDLLNKLLELLKSPTNNNTFNEIRKITTEFDVNSIETVVYYLFEKVDEYAKGKEALIIAELGELNWQLQLVIPKLRDITFLACAYKILQHLQHKR